MIELGEPRPYRCCYGHMERCEQTFPTWAQALDFAKRKREDYKTNDTWTVSLYNDDHADVGHDGLTDEQRLEWLGA